MQSRATSRLRRGAALYIVVLSTALIVSLLGLAGLTVARVERRQIGANSDRENARRNANSAVELALRVIANDSNWRTNYSNGVETSPQQFSATSDGTVSWILEDSDGSLTDADTDLRLKGVGRVGGAVQVSGISLASTVTPLSCLETAVCANNNLRFLSNSVVNTSQTAHANAGVASSGTINSDVEAAGFISGSGYNGATNSPVAARALPTAAVFDFYVNNGKAIAYTDLPKAGPARQLIDVVLSPASNPYGATDANGVYVIDCQGGKIRVQYSRIIGTLVLLNVDPLSDIENSLSMEPAVANYPTLLVQGGIEFRLNTTPLSESGRGVNFNPSGSPYQGSADNDLADDYPSQIRGLVYVSGDANVKIDDTVIDGQLVAGNDVEVSSGETLTVTYDSTFFTNPPPGFYTGGGVVPVAGSWLWEAAP